MTTASPLKKSGTDTRWLVKNDQGETFGPVDFETLRRWAKDGRLAPTNTLSENAKTWDAVTRYPELEMNWVAEVSPGAFYGPIHKLALEALQKEGAIPADAVTFQRPPPVRSASKTQPVSPIYPVFPTAPALRNDAEALRSLERQLDLERQRSHDLMKQLQQVREALADLQVQLARQTDAFAQAHEHLREGVGTVHDELTQRLAHDREQAHLQLQTLLTAGQAQLSADLHQLVRSELAQTQERLTRALAVPRQEAFAQTTQAVTQAVAPLAAQVAQQRQALERFEALLTATDTHTADAVVSAVATLLAQGREALLKKMGDDLAACHEQLFERIHAVLLQGREQMMRATGDSQRIAIEYLVRELTSVLTQTLQAGRETLLQSMRGGWAETKQQATTLEALLRELQATHLDLERELKRPREAHERAGPPPMPERTYVEAEAVEVIPPERPRKKHPPGPEGAAPPPASQTGSSRTAGQNLSMADIEQQARRELERLGAQGMNLFKRKK